VEAYGKRLLLECLSARQAAIRITPGEIQNLQHVLEDMQGLFSLKDLSRSRQLSREFHLSIVRAADDALLLRLYMIVSNSFPDWMLYEAMFRHPELLNSSMAQECDEHRALLEALLNHRPEDAAVRAKDHILHMGRNLVSLLGISLRDLQEQEKAAFPFIIHAKEEAGCQNNFSTR
jgi:GntR family transcriptional repressor for pyruvate dehydrogenase complex